MTAQSQNTNIGPGPLIKRELKDRRISQKDFAKAIGVGQSYISDILSGRRRVSIPFAENVESLLGIPSRVLMDLQIAKDIVLKSTDPETADNIEAEEILNKIDERVCLKALFKAIRRGNSSPSEKRDILKSIFGLSENFSQEIELATRGCFRKSALTGLDMRMISTWVILVKAISKFNKPTKSYNRDSIPELCKKASKLFHENLNTIARIEELLDSYGIGFLRVDKLEHASIDGFSFFSNGRPFIAVTCRYDRIDNLAFTVLHELAHLYLGHTTPDHSSLNVDTRSYDEDCVDEREDIADKFAGEFLIPNDIWMFAPKVISNPWMIQKAYADWAYSKQLNLWIVLGRLSHETGMYRFRSNDTRKIDGGKEVCHAIEL